MASVDTKGPKATSQFLSKLRKPVDTFAPSLGLLYRCARDLAVGGEAKPTRYGFTLAGDPLMARDDFEIFGASALLEMIESHETVIDIGANVGFYSCLAASRGKQVLAFEPSPRNLKYLYRNLWGNKFQGVEVFPLGLAKQPGLNRLYGFGGISSFVPGWAQAEKGRFTIVPVTNLDTMVAERFRRRRLLIKMDVEGFELDVLAGAERTLDLDPKPTWMVEILLDVETIPGGTNRRFAEAFEVFWRHGYECKKLNESRDPVGPENIRRWIANGSVDDGTHDFLFFGPGL
ncbi:MAG: FkbM family methyltransferase [Candidatus Acidiferrales bacterium]